LLNFATNAGMSDSSSAKTNEKPDAARRSAHTADWLIRRMHLDFGREEASRRTCLMQTILFIALHASKHLPVTFTRISDCRSKPFLLNKVPCDG
jgi:hypothetical protein